MFKSLAALLILLVGWLDLFLFTTLLYILSYLPKKLLSHFFAPLFQRWCRCFVRAIGVELHVHEQYAGTLPPQYIVIANHPSALEDIGMPSIFNVRFVAKYEVQFWWIVGRISRAANTIFVKREDPNDRAEALKTILNALKQGDSIGLYPEGGCYSRKIHLPFQSGAAKASFTTQVPILPVFLYHEAQVQFEWHNQHLLHKIWQMVCSTNKHVHYYIHTPIYPQDFDSIEALKSHLEHLYLQLQQRYLE